MSIFATEYDPASEPEPACDEPECHDLLEQNLLGDWFCPTCKRKKEAMTHEQINDAITEATGLWDHPYSSDTKRMYDFCTDLNAMHEAEEVLGNAVNAYGIKLMHLIQVTDKDCPSTFIWHATARQRAEAFLRTIGKWEATTEESSADHFRDATKKKEVQS